MAFDFPNAPTIGQTQTGPTGNTYVWDGTKWIVSTLPSTFAPINSPTFTGDPKAPTATPGDNDTSLATTAFVTNAMSGLVPSLANNRRNFLDNVNFIVVQRGNGPFTTNGYGIDRWKLVINADALSVSNVAAVDADRSGIGDETARFLMQNTFTGTAGAGAYSTIVQPIEDVFRLANKTVTVSFYAKAGSGTPKLGVSIDQGFGTGGTPSATVFITGQSVTLSTSWARYALTFSIPSVAGKTIGSNNDHNNTLLFWFSSGATNNVRSGSVGVQSATISLWGMQLELGSSASVLDKVDAETEVAACLRFYNTDAFVIAGLGSAGVAMAYVQTLPSTMRAQPTLATTGLTQVNCIGTVGNLLNRSIQISATPSANGGVIFAGTYTASAEL